MIHVLFEDNHLLVVDKPAGLLTQQSGTKEESLEIKAKEWLKKKYEKKGNVFLHPIHRLDRAAGGIVVFAKTGKALSRLNHAIRHHHAKKIYHALVHHPPPVAMGELTHYLLQGDYRACVVEKGVPGAKLAQLRYRVLQEVGGIVHLEVELITGRYHQIRAQLAAIGLPIIGDAKYGSQENWAKPGIALQHVYFEIFHPITKERLIFESKEKWELGTVGFK